MVKIARTKLKRCRDLRNEAERYELLLIEAQPSFAANLDAMPKGTTVGKPTESAAVRLVSIEELMLKIIQERNELVSEITTACLELTSLKRQIIILRYIDGLTWKKISEELGYTTKWLMDLHTEAVREITY